MQEVVKQKDVLEPPLEYIIKLITLILKQATSPSVMNTIYGKRNSSEDTYGSLICGHTYGNEGKKERRRTTTKLKLSLSIFSTVSRVHGVLGVCFTLN